MHCVDRLEGAARNLPVGLEKNFYFHVCLSHLLHPLLKIYNLAQNLFVDFVFTNFSNSDISGIFHFKR